VVALDVLEYLRESATVSRSFKGLLRHNYVCFDQQSYLAIADTSELTSFFIVLYPRTKDGDEYKLYVYYGVSNP
jgi:hypothetical protein